ncbi:hypothetical protein SERLA73DRAFT_54656 [Serpula lacrymans var. lacrymans S7.3]|uniref:Zinc finger PHD-type domain-containing protein n=1 Tax=Serpula lacrymans var. lacrymans (strain S7.3) TaxID=936435 RepID=F8PYS2_SERL3|nr:hypothetical protein SERLA73DRAFT_54656 [Serpula lacrymans var. lacrymans S7.3]
MPRRTSARTAASSSTPRAASPAYSTSAQSLSPELQELRRQWKWAAFSQFFSTFSSLFALSEVTVTDIEDDLTCATNSVLPRIMHRLLYTLTQDRKISLDNWQTALRKQYNKRDPDSNPIGPIELDPSANNPQSSRTSAAPDFGPSGNLADEKGDETSAYALDQACITKYTTEDPLDAPGVQEEEGPSSPVQPNELPTEDSKNWLDLPMLTKLESMHTLMEWQFQNPHRLRTLMKDDDETAQWRIEPIGYDSQKNAYWLIGADRLWIQREPPRANSKRKRGAKSNSIARLGSLTISKGSQRSKKRQRGDIDPDEDAPSSKRNAQLGRPRTLIDFVPTGARGGRAAKARANQKLDAQAKELAEFQQQMLQHSRKQHDSPVITTSSPRKPVGTRLSARLRGAIAEEEWQEIPQEWLLGDSAPKGSTSDRKATSNGFAGKVPKTGLESDIESISDLTELSEDPDDDAGGGGTPSQDEVTDHDTERPRDCVTVCPIDYAEDLTLKVPNNFIEWETICVTLQEWERIADRFEKATHYSEKVLYKTLAHGIVPVITNELREIERKRRLEEAVVHRKRSSRIAIKESEKEEARMAAKRKAEEVEKLSRARRLEVRLQKEEADRQRRENAREQRRKEREQKDKEQITSEGKIDLQSVILTPSQDTRRSTRLLSVPGSGSRTPMGEEWELDCEVCHKRGINQDDGTPMMCCGLCSKWQHISCHDKADSIAGRQQRNWDREEFVCQRCSLSTKTSMFDQQLPFQGIPSKPPSRSVGHQPYFLPGFSEQRSYGSASYYTDGFPNGHSNHEQHQSDLRVAAIAPSNSRPVPQSSHSTVTFAHYQPHQRGFSTTLPTHSVEDPSHLQASQHPQYSSQRSGYSNVARYPSFQVS